MKRTFPRAASPLLAACATLTMYAGVAVAETAAPPPPPAPPKTSATDAAAEAWLDRLSARSAEIRTFQADVRYDRNQGLVGDKQRRFGRLVYRSGPPASFAIHFDRLVVDDRLQKQDRWYVYDGTWLVERLDSEKQFTKRQVVAPPAPGSAATPADRPDPLDLGEGPFALPITTNKERILRRFDVTVEPAAPEDPDNTVHLGLVPKSGTKSEYTRVDLWYDKDMLLPVRARTLDESENETVIFLSKTKVNAPTDDKTFDTSEPKEKGWRVEVTPWEAAP